MERYARQMALSEIGESGQQRLARSRVLIVGVGGLGSPIALYLAAAGVGTIGLIDNDIVSASNLQRQVLYTEEEVGRPKTECAARRLKRLNSTIEIVEHNVRLTPSNAEAIIGRYDYVVDGCDNFATRYTINDTCKQLRTPYIYGAITDFSGQVAVFDYQNNVDYETLYPDREYFEQQKPDTPAPVIGSTPAVIGSIEVNQVLQLICRFGNPLINKLLTVDLRTMEFNTIALI